MRTIQIPDAPGWYWAKYRVGDVRLHKVVQRGDILVVLDVPPDLALKSNELWMVTAFFGIDWRGPLESPWGSVK